MCNVYGNAWLVAVRSKYRMENEKKMKKNLIRINTVEILSISNEYKWINYSAQWTQLKQSFDES